jgi:hypothetical protein
LVGKFSEDAAVEPAAADGAFIDADAACVGVVDVDSLAMACSWDSLSSRDTTLEALLDNMKCFLTVGTILL